MTRSWRQTVRRIPAAGALILRLRRWTGSTRIARVATAAPADRLVVLDGAHVSAQPIAVVSADRIYQWALCPQLKRAPTTADVLWRDLRPPEPLPGRTLFAAVDGFSYYHWLLGTLPKLLFARAQGADLAAFDRIVVNPRHKGKVNFQTESLVALGLDLDKMLFVDRGLHLRCDRLTLPPEPTRREQTDVLPWAIDALRREFLPPAAPPPTPERLFIRRAAARRRRLVDEPAVEAELVRLGFTAVTLEALSWREQIALFAGARAVVGLHGAGLSNLVFSPPGTRVVEILPNVWRNPCFANLAARVGATYANLGARPVGERTGFAADARVDLPELLAVLDRSLA